MSRYGSAAEYFDHISRNLDPERARGIKGTYLFDISGAGKWTADFRDGEVTIEEGETKEPECTIMAGEEDWLRLVSGELDPMSATMSGKLRMKGDMSKAMQLQKIL
ncbi:SCP2 sterol-binding domain-containing protein [Rubrobacter taiwanensis]|uniref:SCP2 sterol-binding domain-containing protein n=1 Tax=Rubrobacter taiwanensis TaxID=185139 RepID=UPI00140446D3|nr:SCP2 sterol-binding domain-containing protein [Rubrobacter taiwanensis]